MHIQTKSADLTLFFLFSRAICHRPELLVKLNTPLSSDAFRFETAVNCSCYIYILIIHFKCFSGFARPDPKWRQYNNEVKIATDRLFREIIPEFVREMKTTFFGETFALTVCYSDT